MVDMRSSMTNRIQFVFVRFQRRTVLVTPSGTQHQPAPSDLRIIPGRNRIRARPQDQVEMIGKNRESQQINTEVLSLTFLVRFRSKFYDDRNSYRSPDHRPAESTCERTRFITCTVATSSGEYTSDLAYRTIFFFLHLRHPLLPTFIQRTLLEVNLLDQQNGETSLAGKVLCP